MNCVECKSFGKPASKNLELNHNKEKPKLTEPNQVLIKVISASINPIDYKMVWGDLNSLLSLKTPYAVGFDVAGIVAEKGDPVKNVEVGDKVYARLPDECAGSLAQYAVCPANLLAKMPNNLSFDESASIPLAGLTALEALREVLKVKQGDRVLILGGSGGVGTLAVQLASKVLGCEVITTCGPEKTDLCKLLGATQVINYKEQKYYELLKDSPVDAVFDTTGDVSGDGFKILKKNGKWLSIIATPTVEGFDRAGLKLSTAAKAMIGAGALPTQAKAKLHGIDYDFLWMWPSGELLSDYAKWLEEGKIRPVLDKVYKLNDFQAAFDHLETGHAAGKVVVHIQDDVDPQ